VYCKSALSIFVHFARAKYFWFLQYKSKKKPWKKSKGALLFSLEG
jgi:hypothetical protein